MCAVTSARPQKTAICLKCRIKEYVMIFRELTVYTNTLGSELVGSAINDAGISCFSVEDPADFEALLNDKTVPYDYIEEGLLTKTDGETLVRVYIAKNEQGDTQLASILSSVEELKEMGGDFGRLHTEITEVNDESWADNWKQFFHPLEIGEKFIVKPTWESCESSDRVVLEIDPASSFGTGQHETTALCLCQLEKLDLADATVLDMGCGSGILGIGAAKTGAKEIVLVDIDKTAADIAAENLEINGVSQKGKVFCGNVLDNENFCKEIFSKTYDVIVANIVADIIKEMTPLFKASLKDGGVLICSGIIGSRAEEIRTVLGENGFTIEETLEKNDWVAIKCKK